MIKFHVHIDALAIAIDAILAQPSEDNMDHPFAYARRKINRDEKELFNNRTRSTGYDIFLANVLTLSSGEPIYFLYRSPSLEVPCK